MGPYGPYGKLVWTIVGMVTAGMSAILAKTWHATRSQRRMPYQVFVGDQLVHGATSVAEAKEEYDRWCANAGPKPVELVHFGGVVARYVREPA